MRCLKSTMKIYGFNFFLLVILTICNNLSSQTIFELLNSNEYFIGIGEAFVYEEAIKKADDDLTRSISSFISIEYSQKIKEHGDKADEYTNIVTQTISSAFIRDIQRKEEILPNGKYKLYHFILKSDYEKVLDNIREKIKAMKIVADNAKKEFNFSRALQYYYHSLIIINSIPEVILSDKNNNDIRIEIINNIEDILKGITITYVNDLKRDNNERTLKLMVTYRDTNIEDIDFYHTVDGFNHLINVRSGYAWCKLFGAAINQPELRIRIKYMYEDKKDLDNIVKSLWDVTKKATFQENIKHVNIQMPLKSLPGRGIILSLDNQIECPVSSQIYHETIKFLEVLKNNQIKELSKLYPDDIYFTNKVNDLYRFNNIRLLDSDFNLSLEKTWTGWELRGIPVLCNYPSINKSTTEFLILDYDQSGNLNDISFEYFNPLFTKEMYNKLFSSEEKLRRLTIIKFLEKYRTAFLSRDIKTLERIFSDDAIIIVGRLYNSASTIAGYVPDENSINYPKFEQLKFTKQQYLSRQQQIFRNQRDIHLGFGHTTIHRPRDKHEIYTLSMRQQYASSTYADEGYLFLIIDFAQNDPLIHVRSWQPNEWLEKDLIGLKDFKIPR